MEPIVEEELIDNQESETPIVGTFYENSKKGAGTPMKVPEDDQKSQSRITNNDNLKASSRPASEIQKKETITGDDSNGLRP